MLNINCQTILVTGCYRSGTTVVEKILNMHPSITVASQPFPILYFMVKERFNQSIGIEKRYPLDHLFLDNSYTPEEFNNFLKKYILDEAALKEFSQRMSNYSSGLWTPEILDILDTLKTGSFFDVYEQLNWCIARLFPAPEQRYIGSKEVLIEEFAQPLVGIGTKIIFVIRDPRAMIASLNFRVRDNLTGGLRPILYSLRAWRKGVALAIAATQRGGACMIRYEDLVSDQKATLTKLTDFLAVSPYAANTFVNGITDQRGEPWTGNSSFSDQKGISHSSLKAFAEHLPLSTQNFIEALCAPEMRLLGYQNTGSLTDHEQAISNYRDHFESVHKSFPADYSSNPKRIAEERKRLLMLEEGLTDSNAQRKWFIAPEAYSALKTAS